MYNLLNFLVKNSFWFVFILLEFVCFYFVFSDNSYQRSVFLNSSNEITGRIYSISSGATSYFGLKSDNMNLLEKNGELQNRIFEMEKYIFELEKDSIKTQAFLDSEFESDNIYIPARVLNNSVSRVQNYMTINKGSKNGIKVGMGVVSQEGVVGEVRAVSTNFSVVQSLLNTNSKFSCKLLSSNAFAPLEWGENRDSQFAIMKEYPSHERVAIGDTVVTSGFSDVFPSGVLVGTVHNFGSNEDVNQYEITIKLSTNFNSLKNVLVVRRDHLEEKHELEKQLNVKN